MNFAKVPPWEKRVGGIWVIGAGVLREKIFGIPNNLSQGIPDDSANLSLVSQVPPTFALML